METELAFDRRLTAMGLGVVDGGHGGSSIRGEILFTIKATNWRKSRIASSAERPFEVSDYEFVMTLVYQFDVLPKVTQLLGAGQDLEPKP